MRINAGSKDAYLTPALPRRARAREMFDMAHRLKFGLRKLIGLWLGDSFQMGFAT